MALVCNPFWWCFCIAWLCDFHTNDDSILHGELSCVIICMISADVMELVDMQDLGSCAERHRGSSPRIRTTNQSRLLKIIVDYLLTQPWLLSLFDRRMAAYFMYSSATLIRLGQQENTAYPRALCYTANVRLRPTTHRTYARMTRAFALAAI